MTTKLKKIRTEILEALVDETIAEGRVYWNRSILTWQENLPAINFYVTDVLTERTDEAPARYQKNADLVFECIVEGDDDEEMNDQADIIAEQVEEILGRIEAKDGVNCTVDDLLQTGMHFEQVPEGERPTTSVKLVYNARWWEDRPATQSGQGITDLAGIDIQWNIDGITDEADAAKDQLELPE